MLIVQTELNGPYCCTNTLVTVYGNVFTMFFLIPVNAQHALALLIDTTLVLLAHTLGLTNSARVCVCVCVCVQLLFLVTKYSGPS